MFSGIIANQGTVTVKKKAGGQIRFRFRLGRREEKKIAAGDRSLAIRANTFPNPSPEYRPNRGSSTHIAASAPKRPNLSASLGSVAEPMEIATTLSPSGFPTREAAEMASKEDFRNFPFFCSA